tara:strand:- start:1610 stop:2707 length:1098 start_codon:yes stop_codon:yes gene_type:complete
MQLDFFPSRTLTLYLAKMFVVRILAVLAMLVLVLLMLDLLSSSGDILANEDNGQSELWTYASLRFPLLLRQFTPYSVLLATLITLVTLNQNSEVVAMKSAGLSAHQILAPLLFVSGMIAVGNFILNETWAVRSEAVLKAWEEADYGTIPRTSNLRVNVYFTTGADVLVAQRVYGDDASASMHEVTFYERNPSGMIISQTQAETAVFNDPGWKLTNAVRFDVATASTVEQTQVVVAHGISPDQITLEDSDPDRADFFALAQMIKSYDLIGKRTSEMRVSWWRKITSPLSSMLMPLLGSVAAFGLARSGQLFVRAVIGMGLGFGYFVVENAALAMGNFGGYPPFLAAWSPFLLFLLIGETVLVRTEE